MECMTQRMQTTKDGHKYLTAACSNRSRILCSEPPETPDTIMLTRGFSRGTSRCCKRQVNNKQNLTPTQQTFAVARTHTKNTHIKMAYQRLFRVNEWVSMSKEAWVCVCVCGVCDVLCCTCVHACMCVYLAKRIRHFQVICNFCFHCQQFCR